MFLFKRLGFELQSLKETSMVKLKGSVNCRNEKSMTDHM